MRGIGDRLRARARELELSDSEVARRLGLGQARYANYVAENREPDFETLVRICRVLRTTPNELLGFEARRETEGLERLQERIAAATQVMDAGTLGLAADIMDLLARQVGSDTPGPIGEPT